MLNKLIVVSEQVFKEDEIKSQLFYWLNLAVMRNSNGKFGFY